MRRNRKIRWGTPVGVKQFHSSFFGTERSLPGEFSLFLLCTLLFFGAACGMLQSMFEWKLLSGGILFRIFFVTVAVSALTEATFLLKTHYRVLARVGILGIGTMGCLFYLLRTKQGERILFGMQAVAFDYVGRWNRYFKTSYKVPDGDMFLLEEAVGFALTVLCFVLVWYGRIRKKAYIAVTVPFLALVAGLLVGKAPAGLYLFLAAFAVFLSNAASFRRPEFLAVPDKYGRESGQLRQFLWIPVAAVLLVICLIVKTTGTTSAGERVIRGEEKIRLKQKEVLEDIAEWRGWQEFSVEKTVERAIDDFLRKHGVKTGKQAESNYARLDNDMPEYQEETVLKVALEKKPVAGAYLIGFYADAYKDGVWDTDVEVFQRACKKAGFEPEEISDALPRLVTGRVAEHYGKESLTDSNYYGIGGWLYHAKASRIKTYLPYFAEVTAEGVTTEGDSRYIKEKSVTKIPFTLWNYNMDELIGILFRGGETKKAWEKEPWENWYESYVTEAYLDLPKGMEQVKKVADEIRNSERNFFRIEGKESVNFDRINKAYQVAEWMRRNTTYSLELPELPKNSDPVEFFLGTSRQGYCMHYAGASALILRELGVPARYVSGYVVGSYVWNELNHMYEAVVLDSDAHAWVEIYLEGIGWVPVEVTKGYSISPSGERIYRQTENGSYQVIRENWPEDLKGSENSFHWETTRPFVTPTPTEAPTMSTAPSVGGTTDVPITGEPENSVAQVGGADMPQIGDETDAPELKDEDSKKKDEKVDLNVNPVVLVFALPIIGIFFGVIVPLSEACRKVKSKADESAIQKKSKRFGNRQKINLLNRRLYRKLRGKGKIYKKFLRDEEYDEVLRKYSTVLPREERERYMHLVKAAAFSYNEFTEEDVVFCKQVYHKVLYEKRKDEDERE